MSVDYSFWVQIYKIPTQDYARLQLELGLSECLNLVVKGLVML